jgi:hypothetical protein
MRIGRRIIRRIIRRCFRRGFGRIVRRFIIRFQRYKGREGILGVTIPYGIIYLSTPCYYCLIYYYTQLYLLLLLITRAYLVFSCLNTITSLKYPLITQLDSW